MGIVLALPVVVTGATTIFTAGGALIYAIHRRLQAVKPPVQPPPGLVAFSAKKSLQPEAVREAAKRSIGLSKYSYNVAFCGERGAGKSQLVGALTCKKTKCGAVECTHTAKGFPFAENIVLWDVPGDGTMAHPTITYVEDQCLYAYDAVVIVYGLSVSENFLKLIAEMQSLGIPVLLVRSKMDQALEGIVSDNSSIAPDMRRMHLTEEIHNVLLRDWKAYAAKNPECNPMPPPLFCISSVDLRVLQLGDPRNLPAGEAAGAEHHHSSWHVRQKLTLSPQELDKASREPNPCANVFPEDNDRWAHVHSPLFQELFFMHTLVSLLGRARGEEVEGEEGLAPPPGFGMMPATVRGLPVRRTVLQKIGAFFGF